MKIGKRITALMLIAAMSLVGVGCSSANGEGKSARVIRVAHGQNEEHPQHKALLEFEKYVEEKTNNEQIEMCFKAYKDEKWQTQFD